MLAVFVFAISIFNLVNDIIDYCGSGPCNTNLKVLGTKKSAKRFVLKNVNVNREWFYGLKKNDFGQSFIVIVEKYNIT